MAWSDFHKTKTGKARKFNKNKGVWENGSYYPRERINGVKVCKAAGHSKSTAKEIEGKLEDWRVRAKEGLPVSVTLIDARREYEEHIGKQIEQDEMAAQTLVVYRLSLDKLFAFVDDKEERLVESVKKHEIFKFRTKLSATHKPGGVLAILKNISAFFKFCISCGYASVNPVFGNLENLEARIRKTYYTDEQIRHVIQTCMVRKRLPAHHADAAAEFQDIIKVAMATSLRQREISLLRCVNKETREVATVAKGRKLRIIPIRDERLWGILEKYIDRGHEYIFHMWSPGRIRQFWQRLIRRARKTMPSLPIEFCFHGMRHTGISNAIGQGMSLEDAQELAGHSSKATTERFYKHLQKGHVAAVWGKLKNTILDEPGTQLGVI